MFKLIAALIPFVKELFFDKKEEMDFNSKHFNTKKWLQYMSFIVLFTSILFVGGRLFTLTFKYLKLEEDYRKLQVQVTKATNRNNGLEARIDLCENSLAFAKEMCTNKFPKKNHENKK